jgi:hypothetical protein
MREVEAIAGRAKFNHAYAQATLSGDVRECPSTTLAPTRIEYRCGKTISFRGRVGRTNFLCYESPILQFLSYNTALFSKFSSPHALKRIYRPPTGRIQKILSVQPSCTRPCLMRICRDGSVFSGWTHELVREGKGD